MRLDDIVVVFIASAPFGVTTPVHVVLTYGWEP